MREYTKEALLIQQARACFLEHLFDTFQINEARGREVTGNDYAAAAAADFLAADVEHRSHKGSGGVPLEAAIENVLAFTEEHSDWPRSA